MRRNHSRSPYSTNEGGSLLGTLLRTLALLIILGAAGGITWLALTPLDAPTHQVVREVSHDKLGPG